MASWVILGRDGVINMDPGRDIKNADEWQPISGSIEAIAKLCNANYNVVVATNQPGIGKSSFSVRDLDNIHKKLDASVEQRGGIISGIFYCPHRPDENCQCRKPKTGLLREIEAQFSISLENVPFVGDSESDIEAALAMQCEPILVRTGHGTKTVKQIRQNPRYQSIPVYDDLKSYVQTLLA